MSRGDQSPGGASLPRGFSHPAFSPFFVSFSPRASRSCALYLATFPSLLFGGNPFPQGRMEKEGGIFPWRRPSRVAPSAPRPPPIIVVPKGGKSCGGQVKRKRTRAQIRVDRLLARFSRGRGKSREPREAPETTEAIDGKRAERAEKGTQGQEEAGTTRPDENALV